MKIAAVTMVYNERIMLPWWLRYYSREVGERHCYIIDQASDDGSTRNVGEANVLKIPRSPVKDEAKRADFISEFCASMLKFYDWIIYSDVDEILVPDPSHYASLSEYCAGDRPDVITAFGVNVLQRYQQESAIDPERLILGQRQWMFATSSMAKPLLTRIPVRWPGGFHSSSASVVFDGLTNFHVAYADFNSTIARQMKRRSSFLDRENCHQQMTDSQIFHMMRNWSFVPTITDVELNQGCHHTCSFVDKILASSFGRKDDFYKIDFNIWNERLWRIPKRFSHVF